MFTGCQLQPPLGGSSHPLEEGAGAILRISHLFSVFHFGQVIGRDCSTAHADGGHRMGRAERTQV